MMDRLKDQLIRHEGLCLKPYKDTVGKLTIGVGRNIDDNGITREEAIAMLEYDIHRCEAELISRIGNLFHVCDARWDVLVNMCFNLGITRLMKFKKMIAAVKTGDYDQAAREMIDSKWATQVGNRAIELAEQMRKGSW